MNKELAYNILINLRPFLPYGTKVFEPKYELEFREAYEVALESLREAEPIKHGKWKRIKAYPDLVFCDECGEPFKNNPSEKWNYCPNCGVKMEVEE